MKSKFLLISTCCLLFLFQNLCAQNVDSLSKMRHFSGSLSITHNGLSFIPTFSLGKPASIINLSIGSSKFNFEPELRFDLEAKPWSFLFWFRYKMQPNKKWRINIGMHPALNFRAEVDSSNGVAKENLVTRRYLATEFAPSYFLKKDISVGLYFLYSRGLDAGTLNNSFFLTLNTSFSNVEIASQFFMKFTPQVYYLNLDGQDGVYMSEATTLSKKGFPISISAIFNKTLRSNITANKDFVWNVSLVYSFQKSYYKLN